MEVAQVDREAVRCLPPELNAMQTACRPTALESDSPFLLSAPTGAGKSVVLAMAMLRCCRAKKQKAVYLCPTKALCRQQMDSWSSMFAPIELKCFVITGDQGTYREAFGADVLFTTPEKLDVLTRRWLDHAEFFSCMGLLMIDEVHMLSESRRGAVLEALVSRLRFVKKQTGGVSSTLRFVAVSATVPNLHHVARWLEAPVPQGVLSFGPEFRPCPLEKVVESVPSFRNNPFLADRVLDARVPILLNKYGRAAKPSLVFCSTRKGCQKLAEKLGANGFGERIALTREKKALVQRACEDIQDDPDLRACIMNYYTAWHTAGVSMHNLKIVENLFRQGLLGVLTATTTLAQGVNLPASLVIVKNTKAYRGASNGLERIPITTILQMVGRAGRRGFDTSGTAVILAEDDEVDMYRSLLDGVEPVRSALQEDMKEILVNEIVIGAITNTKQALAWLETTFLYKSIDPGNRKERATLKSSLFANLKSIQDAKCAALDEHGRLVPTELGRIVCKHYLRLQTGLSFASMLQGEMNFIGKACGLYEDEAFQLILRTVAKAAEFSDLALRKDQKKWLNQVNWETGRFRNKKNTCRVSNVEEKVFQLFQALFSQLSPPDQTLRTELGIVAREAERILSALAAYLKTHEKHPLAVQAEVLLRCISTKSWPEGGELLQLEQIGPKLAQKLQTMGISSLDDLVIASKTRLEMLQTELGKGRMARALDKARLVLAHRVSLRVKFLPGHLSPRKVTIMLDIAFQQSSVSSAFSVFVMSSDQLLHSLFIRPGETRTLDVPNSTKPSSLYVAAIHPVYHGVDDHYPSRSGEVRTLLATDYDQLVKVSSAVSASVSAKKPAPKRPRAAPQTNAPLAQPKTKKKLRKRSVKEKPIDLYFGESPTKSTVRPTQVVDLVAFDGAEQQVKSRDAQMRFQYKERSGMNSKMDMTVVRSNPSRSGQSLQPVQKCFDPEKAFVDTLTPRFFDDDDDEIETEYMETNLPKETISEAEFDELLARDIALLDSTPRHADQQDRPPQELSFCPLQDENVEQASFFDTFF